MQLILLFSFGCLAVNAVGVEQPLLKGLFQCMDAGKGNSLLGGEKFAAHLTNRVSFLLYTNSNPDEAQKIHLTDESVGASNFNSKYPTVFFFHGWVQDCSTTMSIGMRHAYFTKGMYNFICVQWDRAMTGYMSAVGAVPGVGKQTAEICDLLVQKVGTSIKNITLVGHSLGSHVAGFCGKNVKSGKIPKIYGLDPASPCYNIDKPEERLNSNDALYVEAIHTNGGKLGFEEKVGKVDIYANGGKHQPGCEKEDFLTGLCSHRRSVDLFIESINSDQLITTKCDNYKVALASECGKVFSDVRLGGEDNYLLDDGVYYLDTNDKPPYGEGTA